MPLTSKHTFRIGSYGRSTTDEGWEKLEPEHIRVWQSALSLLSARTMKVQNCTVRIEANWMPILRKQEKHYNVMKRLQKGAASKAELRSILEGFPERSTEIEITTEMQGDEVSEEAAKNLATSVIESYLYDFFAILNVSAPGCCDFYRGQLVGGSFERDIPLSGFYFDIAVVGTLEKEWQQIRTLPLAQTVRWYDSVRSDIRQIPQNPMERALFALLHISKIDTDPMIVIWLFYAFESLFQTRAGENFSSLVQRIILLFNLDDTQAKIVRREFRELYNTRSAIVHGGFEIAHPMQNEVLDKAIDDHRLRISETAEFGLALLLAAIQETIARGWRYPIFSERLDGSKIG
ncbi:HEPN domain-containing protein [Bradyrhizobium sp. RP6]|uniref:HEPN domain-containing protein n=1 Tax=Bradyrhizobium sp. RP6 TaxID=2489596 RepID=UPI000F54898E|nr:HEPN domain-containing protein [Bradyrhizobium sp. RP6]RQH05898.1 hypothetical protein EHH60_31595 [Bradyrhizobium sp. RP6]